MKFLVLASFLLFTGALSAHADNNSGGVLTCELSNNRFVTFHLISGKGGLSGEGTHLTIVANGVLHTVIDSVVTKVNPSRASISVDVSTLNAQGQVDENSGTATVEIGLKVLPNDAIDGLSGKAEIHLTKFPPRVPDNIVFQEHYELTGCTGSI